MKNGPDTRNLAVQITAAHELVVVEDKALAPLGPTQMLLQTQACGICFSDTKLLAAFDTHPRKGDVRGGLDPDVLSEIPSYRPGNAPTVPGHEPVARIVAVGEDVVHHAVGERVLIQPDLKHLPTASSNSAFGYNFEGALQEFIVIDERAMTDPESGDDYLIPVSEVPSSSAVALVEPWACVEAAYAWEERQTLRPGGDVLVVLDAGRTAVGLDSLLAHHEAGRVTVVADASPPGVQAGRRESSLDALEGSTFDDVIYVGSDAVTFAQLGPMLAYGGLCNVVLGGVAMNDRAPIDVGRVHYDLIRYVGTMGQDVRASYMRIPPGCEIRPGEQMAIVGAAGPMGLMHTMRTVVSGVPDITVAAVDVDVARLEHLAEQVGPVAARQGVPLTFRTPDDAAPGYTYISLMVPAPGLLADAVREAGSGAIVNAFAGFALGTMASIDMAAIADRGVYLVGSSGSRLTDMKTMLARVESGQLDTNVSLWAVTGMAGVLEAIEAVKDRASGGKIMVYPQLHGLGLTPLESMAEVCPPAAAAMAQGRWCLAAERALLESFELA